MHHLVAQKPAVGDISLLCMLVFRRDHTEKVLRDDVMYGTTV